jgi:hypothetical protein
MNTNTLTENWALWAAMLPIAIGVVSVGVILFRRSSRGQLLRAVTAHKKVARELRKARHLVEEAVSRLARLNARAGKVKPRVLQEAGEALQDARSLEKIAGDQVQVATNQVRRVIFEEFPPSQHERLRRKFLPQDVRENRPFTF